MGRQALAAPMKHDVMIWFVIYILFIFLTFSFITLLIGRFSIVFLFCFVFFLKFAVGNYVVMVKFVF